MMIRSHKPAGFALLLAAAAMVALMAVVFSFSPPGVGAHGCDDFSTSRSADVHKDTDSDLCGTTNHNSLSSSENHASLSSTIPGATNVAIRLTATAEAEIAATKAITVNFSGFSLPTSIAKANIVINPDITANTTFSPTVNATVSGQVVTITVPDGKKIEDDKKFTITFKTSAGIGNPSSEDDWNIVVSTPGVSGDNDDTITAVIERTRVDPLKGSRGKEFRVRGVGYPMGRATIFDGADDGEADPGEVLDTQDIGSDGRLTSAPLRVRGSVSDLQDLQYEVQVKDSKGKVSKVVYYITEPTMSFSLEPARVNDTVTISIEDWQDSTKGVAAVRIAGQQVFGVDEYEDPSNTGTYCYDGRDLENATNNVVSFNATIPPGTLPGMQMVEVYDQDQLQQRVCTSTELDTWTRQTNRVATLKADKATVIEKTIQIVPEGTPLDPQKTTTISPKEGPRGQAFRVEGDDYPTGTVTIYHDADGDEEIDSGEILDTQEVPGIGSRKGEFTSDYLRVRGSLDKLSYRVWAQDSKGDVDSVTYHITKPTMSLAPATALRSGKVTINITDWQLGNTKVAAVHIAGQQAYGVKTYKQGTIYCYDSEGLKEANDNNLVSIEVTVPKDTPLGTQMVEVYTLDQLKHNPRLCTADERNTWAVQTEAELKDNAKPTVRKTIEIVSELPDVDDLALTIQVDGGRSSKMVFKVNPPPDKASYLGENDRIQIVMPAEFTPLPATVDKDKIRFSGSGDGTAAPLAATVDGTISNRTLTLTIPGGLDERVTGDEHLDITIERGNGMIAPETPIGFDDSKKGYPVTITFVDGASPPGPNVTATDENIIVVRNPLSSSVPNDRVEVRLVTYAEERIGPGEEIVVDLSGPSEDSRFFVPPSISNSRVRIAPVGETFFNPSGVLVQGNKVTLTVPTGTATTARNIPAGEFTIVFSNLANIRNPYAAGTQIIEVSSSVEGDLLDEIEAVIKRTTTTDPLPAVGGLRGSEFTLTGKGYAKGTVTIYHDANGNTEIDAGETLDSVTTSRGVFTVTLEVRGKPGDPDYKVRIRDSEGAEEEVIFTIKSGMFFRPTPARVGWPLKITISDWEGDFPPDVVAVTIAGEIAFITEVKEYTNCFEYPNLIKPNKDGVVSFEVNVPRHVPGGQQTVAVYGHNQLVHYYYNYVDKNIATDEEEGEVILTKKACSDLDPIEDEKQGTPVTREEREKVKARLKLDPVAIIKETIEIDTNDLLLSPSTAVRGQRVTITGRGFTRASGRADHIDSVWIGGKRVENDHSEFEVGTDGSIAINVTVPLEIPSGSNEVRIEGNDLTLGLATLVVPEAGITLTPDAGQRDTKFTVTGSGFVAYEPVLVTYHSDEVITKATTDLGVSGMLADGQGGFELEMKVPVPAEVGLSHLITAVSRVEEVVVEAEALHLVPLAAITTAPESVTPGDYLNVRGQHLPPFSLVGPVELAGIPVSLAADVATDEYGFFETRILVPQLDYRDHTLLVQVAGVIIPNIVNVGPPPRSGPPGEVFKELVRLGALQSVWHYDNGTQTWSLFDPLLSDELSALNDLTHVETGYIVWVRLYAPQWFQGELLGRGWGLVELR